ncbi:Uncharacterized protein Fot_17549 [Forsythia ovata]|uniref:Uncharacterized protein n=1 Tax=Forsythia ovata TaxID=205694 RepID=A0ABD1VFR9_9LAMI
MDSHQDLAKTPQFSQNWQNPYAMASKKETFGYNCGIGNLNNVYFGRGHENFEGVKGAEPDGVPRILDFSVFGNPKRSHDFVGLHRTSEKLRVRRQTTRFIVVLLEFNRTPLARDLEDSCISVVDKGAEFVEKDFYRRTEFRRQVRHHRCVAKDFFGRLYKSSVDILSSHDYICR